MWILAHYLDDKINDQLIETAQSIIQNQIIMMPYRATILSLRYQPLEQC